MRYVVDIGASHGLFTSYIERMFREKSSGQIKIFALEPIPEVAARIDLRENIVIVTAAVLPEHRIPHNGKVQLNIFRNHELSSILRINQNLDDRVWSGHLPGTDP
jgi:hypothetical protein